MIASYRNVPCPWCEAEPGSLVMHLGHFTNYPPDIRPTPKQRADTKRLRRQLSCQECGTYTFGELDDGVIVARGTPVPTQQLPVEMPDLELPDDGESLSDTAIRLRREERN